jgi:hypothetical protein
MSIGLICFRMGGKRRDVVNILINIQWVTRRRSLTLTSLTWRIWWAPNNASKRQMGFNSAFKGLTGDFFETVCTTRHFQGICVLPTGVHSSVPS